MATKIKRMEQKLKEQKSYQPTLRSYFGLRSGLLGPRGQSGDTRPSRSPGNQVTGGRGLHTELPSTPLESRRGKSLGRQDWTLMPILGVV